ncbi:alpha-ketoglutarate-dependent dioxygenase AlkB [Anthocerotibacter panamensis]|uniref:alpha-ketoglutarate-dependent dioxygenase AlkB n=1 Tax=Anthocerotibacter panamensis TaxID=2857077 RepID=UPI001C402901|nr:alpha-ketoglutarate-dependent dioxygenase AlkB [Anthocerotibacter panamensis]
MQTNLLPRELSELAPDCWLIPDFLDPPTQKALLEQTREWCAGGFFTPLMPNGTPMNHPICCLGHHWEPYDYHPPRRPFPTGLTAMANLALDALGGPGDQWCPFQPDTALVNWFPPGSSLGAHQDRSEAPALLEAGSPIVTVALGDACHFYLGGYSREAPARQVEMYSGDCLIMAGGGRMRFHEVRRILSNTVPAFLQMQPGRISITIRRARP